MPGFLKVDGSQKPIAVPWLKESGAWKPIAIGYIKVEGTWRIWYTAEVVDDFNRADSGTLGTASDDFSEWTQFTDGWSIVNNAAEHDGGAGPDLASVEMYKATTDIIVEADLVGGTGLGVAFWTQNENNWWAAIPSRREQSNPSFYSCPPGFSLEGDRCRKTTVYSATYQPESTTSVPYCPSPYYDTGSGCEATLYPVYTTSYTGIGCRGYGGCASAGGQCSYSQTCADLGFGPCNCRVPVSSCYCAPFGGSCSGCSGTIGTGYSYRTVTTPARYVCSQGGSLNGTTCTLVENNPADLVSSYSTFPSTINIYKNENGTITKESTSDIGNDPTTLISYIQGISSANTVQEYREQTGKTGTEIKDDYQDAVGSDPASFKVEVVGNNISVKFYSQPQVQGTAYDSKSFIALDAVKTTGAGIIKYENAESNQGTKLDNFRAE